jgi:hypothetical protein
VEIKTVIASFGLLKGILEKLLLVGDEQLNQAPSQFCADLKDLISTTTMKP